MALSITQEVSSSAMGLVRAIEGCEEDGYTVEDLMDLFLDQLWKESTQELDVLVLLKQRLSVM